MTTERTVEAGVGVTGKLWGGGAGQHLQKGV